MQKIAHSHKNLFIVIPSYNESKVIYNVVVGIRQCGYRHILVVDDGSDDSTDSEALRAGAMVLRHGINRGKGAAVKTGIEAAKLSGARMVVTIDGDGQHIPEDIVRTEKFLLDGYDVVIGSRFLTSQRIPVWKKFGNYFANLLTYALYQVSTSDSQSGFRGYGKRALDAISIFSERYAFDMEVFREIRTHHLKTVEIPITVLYTAYSQNKKNRQHLLSAIMTVLKLVLPFL